VPSVRGATAIALTALCVCAPAALAHQGNPNYSSEIHSIAPAVTGLSAQVEGNDDRIELLNRSDSTIVVMGYRGEPYLRFLPDGTVQRNERSPATFLNEDRFGQIDVPASANPKAPPQWEKVAGGGRFDWHDHRIHWMSKTPPEVVRKDESRRVKVFDWKVPVAVEGRPGTITGTLTWLGKGSGGLPVGAVIVLVIVVVGGATLVAVVRRRRAASGEPGAEAW
jgi:hypothetical protein